MKKSTFPTAYGTIHYYTNSIDTTKPWLIFLPGLSADHRLFDMQTEYFNDKYNWLVWDAPAHGMSRPFELKFSMEDLAVYLHDIMQKENIYKAVLVGQSFGGYIAQVYMDLYPNSVLGFISIDSCSLSRKYYSSFELYLLKRTKPIYKSIPWKLLLYLGINGTSTTDYGRNLMKQSWSVYNKEEYCNLADHGYRIFEEAVRRKSEYPLSCPVLLICGKKDNSGSAKSYNRRWSKKDGHPLEWIKGAGHNSNTDAPDIVNQLINDFITNNNIK